MSRRVLPDLAPPGFFRFTRWSHARGEDFATWSDHFRRLGVHTVLVETRIGDGRRQVALYVQGTESVAEDTFRERRRVERCQSAARSGVRAGDRTRKDDRPSCGQHSQVPKTKR